MTDFSWVMMICPKQIGLAVRRFEFACGDPPRMGTKQGDGTVSVPLQPAVGAGSERVGIGGYFCSRLCDRQVTSCAGNPGEGCDRHQRRS